MPTTEAQRRAMKKYREKNKEAYNQYAKDFYYRTKAKLAQLQALVNEISESNGIEPMDCSKLPGAPEL